MGHPEYKGMVTLGKYYRNQDEWERAIEVWYYHFQRAARHVSMVRCIRQLTYCFYKYELPYDAATEQTTVEKFLETELALASSDLDIGRYIEGDHITSKSRVTFSKGDSENPEVVLLRAKRLLSTLLSCLDLTRIIPRHGPGATSDRKLLWDKFRFDRLPRRVTDVFPLDAYYYASLGHVADVVGEDGLHLECSPDSLSNGSYLGIYSSTPWGFCNTPVEAWIDLDTEIPARVILVPKDSRGPRLISAEPCFLQWLQQGVMTELVRHVEQHPLTRYAVHFTDQSINRIAAQVGSRSGLYATLDLKEASDRVSLMLVRALFPEHIVNVFEACRSVACVTPDKKVYVLKKFAPMGSALCFPVMALTIWAILTAGLPSLQAYSPRKSAETLHVYGDDVIVPTAEAENAIKLLERFGLRVNRNKSCYQGLFRESCGMDAFAGADVTPVKLKTVWCESRQADSYVSWISYANSLYDLGYHTAYDKIVQELLALYGPIPSDGMSLSCPSLRLVDEANQPKRFRHNAYLQKRQYKVWVTKAKSVRAPSSVSGWTHLLRWFSEKGRPTEAQAWAALPTARAQELNPSTGDSVCTYTPRHTSMLVRRWR